MWHSIQSNESFLQHLARSCDSNSLLLPILYLLFDARNTPTKVGQLHMCSFVLLVLSGEREFSVKLNKPYAGRPPMDIASFQGSHGDLLLLTVFKVLAETG